MSNTRIMLATLALGTTIAFAGPAFAEKLKATLDGASEVPANTSAGKGTADIDYETIITYTGGYDEMVILRDIRVESYCEHHMVPIIGKAHVAYLPKRRVVGISKLARLVEAYAKRLQIQEKMTAQIANTIDEVLQPEGVAVVIEAQHQCMTTRGVHKTGVTMVTSRMLGAFRTDPSTRREFLTMIGNPTSRGE